MDTLRSALFPNLWLMIAVSAVAQEKPLEPADQLIGVWRIVSYPTSEGDLLKRHGRSPGPIPTRDEPLMGWSYLVFAPHGDCALFYPQINNGQSSHRRIAWIHDEDNFGTWKLDVSVSPWRLDLGSVHTPKWHSIKVIDPQTGKSRSRLEAATDQSTGAVIGHRWTYPAACRIDDSFLTVVWWQNHQFLEQPPEEKRPTIYEGLPQRVIDSLNTNKPLVRDDARVKIPGGVSCFIAQRVSDKPLPIPPVRPLADALGQF